MKTATPSSLPRKRLPSNSNDGFRENSNNTGWRGLTEDAAGCLSLLRNGRPGNKRGDVL
jgi:hypothetical protein